MRILKDEHLEKTVVLTIQADTMSHDVRAWLLDHSHAVKKPGFRQGKVPFPVLFKEKGLEAVDAVVQSRVSEQVAAIIGDRDVSGPLNYRILTDLNGITSDIMVDVYVEITAVFTPSVPDIQWSDMTVDHWTVNPSDDDTDQWLTNRASRTRKTVALAEKRPARQGDVLLYSMQYSCADGTSHETEGSMTLGSGMLPAEFEATLEGIEEGHVVTERLRVPKGFPQPDLVGKKVHFTITFKEIKETIPHEVDEEFAKSQGFETLDALKQHAIKELKESGDVLSGVLLRQNVKRALCQAASFEVPATWVDNLAASLAKSAANVTPEHTSKALGMVRAETIVRHVVKQEKLKAQDKELWAYMQVIAQQQRQSIENVVAFFQKNRKAAAAMTDEILERKALNWISEHCTKVEKECSVREINERLHQRPDSLTKDSESESIIPNSHALPQDASDKEEA